MSDIDIIDLDEVVPLDSGDPLASAQAFLEVLKLVDGIGSGLDADLVRGVTPGATGLALLPTANAAAARTVLGLAAVAASGSATDLTAGTLADGRLSANAALRNSSTAFTAAQTIDVASGPVQVWQIASATKMSLDGGGNLGIGVTHSGWSGSNLEALGIFAVGSAGSQIGVSCGVNASRRWAWYRETDDSLKLFRDLTGIGAGSGISMSIATDGRITLFGEVGVGANPTAGNGALQLATHTTSAGGIALGPDCPVFRAAAGVIGIGDGTTAISTATTVGAAGGASALPATPTGYWRVSINGTTGKIPYYAD